MKQTLIDFIQQAKLDRVGCFQYSPVEGAKANELKNPLPEHIKEERFHRFMQVQAAISAEKLAAKVGSHQTVLVDNITENEIVARSTSDAPEIDGLVYLPLTEGVNVGDFLQAKIVDSDDYDLYGELALI